MPNGVRPPSRNFDVLDFFLLSAKSRDPLVLERRRSGRVFLLPTAVFSLAYATVVCEVAMLTDPYFSHLFFGVRVLAR